MARKKSKKSESEGGFSKMLATTIVLGIVFSAGLITGQRLLRAEARAPMVSLSTTRIAPQPADEEGEPKPSLRTTFSFYEHLTGQAEATPPPAEEPQADVEEPKPAEVPVEEHKPSVEEPAGDAPDVVATPPVEAPEPEAPKPAAKPEAPQPEAAQPVADLLDEVVASIANSDAPEVRAEPALPARYTLQVSSHPDRTSAEREIARLNELGVEPHVIKVNVPGKGELWRVRVGKFHTMDEARDFQGSVKSKRGVAGFVTPL